MTRIVPTVGRKLYYYPNVEGQGFQIDDQPIDATVIYVHPLPEGSEDYRLNLFTVDHSGIIGVKANVPLIQGDDPTLPETGEYAKWMPFQTTQATQAANNSAQPDTTAKNVAATGALTAPVQTAEMLTQSGPTSNSQPETKPEVLVQSVTAEGLTAKIAEMYYFTAGQGVEGSHGGAAAASYVDGLNIDHNLYLLTLCVLRLQNGFTVVGKSACADPKRFDAEIGKLFAFKDAFSQARAFEGYLLKEQMFQATQPSQSPE